MIFFIGFCCYVPASNATAADEYAIKAAFLYKLALFIHWPNEIFPATGEKFKICLLGKDPFGEIIDNTTKTVNIKGSPLLIERFTEDVLNKTPPEKLKQCHILFIKLKYLKTTEGILSSIGEHSILTVSEDDGFMSVGGMIQFYTQDTRIRLRINRNELESAKLKPEATLLSLATICTREQCE
ncbi:YfiR family protein [Candidatus Venteria ishoeyi]|uniref:YfiR family protein n=1 Tax=Candidatus Venteria ishoeyi TaxID=1899563 RepID=UPI0015AD3021|nr:YfiR family protein [Candidatus Venteria ishoeyi]